MDEWIELSTAEGGAVTIKRTNIYALEDSFDYLKKPMAVLYTAQTSEGEEHQFLLAGEYDIVRDEITGGKWSIKWHKFEQTMRKRDEINLLAYNAYNERIKNAPSDMEPT